MVIDSRSGQKGDQVLFASPLTTLEKPTLLTFHLHMSVNRMDTIASFRVLQMSVFGAPIREVFATNGDKGPNWKVFRLCLAAGEFVLAFEATQGVPYASDIAFDDVLVEGDCSLDGHPQLDLAPKRMCSCFTSSA